KMKKNKHHLWLIAIMLLLVLGLAACENNRDRRRAAAEQTTEAPGTASESTAEPVDETAANAVEVTEEAAAEATTEAEPATGEATVEVTDEATAEATAEAEPTTGEATAEATDEATAEATAEAEPAAGSAGSPADETLVPEAETQSETAAAADLTGQRYGLVVSQLQDKGFNDLTWVGMQRAAKELGVAVQFSQDSNPGTAQSRIDQLINQGYDGIVAVGLEYGPALKAAAQANPAVPFAIVDFPNQTATDRGLLFDVDAPAFLAGYLAAGMSQTGTVCTYGGQKIPPVLIFMVGFEHGVEYYNDQHDTAVTVLGWRTDSSLPSGGEGVFATNFSDQTFGRVIAEELATQGCDIIFPVAGAVGLGTAEVAAENGLTLIGVDADQALSNPEYADLYLTSVVKRVDRAVFETVQLMVAGNFEGGSNYIGRLDNGGVGLAPFHSFADRVPAALQTELLGLSSKLLDGTISTGWPIGASRIQTSLTTGPLSLIALRNATYNLNSSEIGSVALNNGEYLEPAAGVEVKLGDQLAYGDLTGDGLEEAVVELITNPADNSPTSDLAVMADQDGTLSQIGSAPLGSGVEIKTLGVEEGLIKVILAVPDSTDSTPTVIKFYGIQNGALVELSSQEVN
ncbi:MAG TPA: BMP family ABC transporter substrate-binding protein, partial [Anaerolineae bacterium]|nr:BMP family ABC transporter substrate-binding protein [Anaerolineae bacterium]